jgi:hypothetical protein
MKVDEDHRPGKVRNFICDLILKRFFKFRLLAPLQNSVDVAIESARPCKRPGHRFFVVWLSRDWHALAISMIVLAYTSPATPLHMQSSGQKQLCAGLMASPTVGG